MELSGNPPKTTKERPSGGKENGFLTVINCVDSIPSIPLEQGVAGFPVTPVTLSPKTGQGKGLEVPEPHSEPFLCLGLTGFWP